MNNLIRYYNQHKFSIWVIIVIIIFVIIAIQVINYFIKTNQVKTFMDSSNSRDTSNVIEDKKSVTSAIGDKNENLDATQRYKDCIVNFINTCKSKDIQKSYALLTDDCKSIVYNNDINLFNEYYYKDRFTSNKNVEIQNWTDNIFKVSFYEDSLSTGVFNENKIDDVISIDEQSNEYKVNVGNYIGQEKIGKEATEENIKLKVEKVYKYWEYEDYSINIENKSGRDIQLDDLKNTDSMYLIDENDIMHNAKFDNLTTEQLVIKNGQSRNIKIRFDNPFISGREIKNLTFSNVMMQGNNSKIEITCDI